MSKQRVQKATPVTPTTAPASSPSANTGEDFEVVAVPADQVLDDPRDHGGIIIPLSNENIYTPGLKALLDVSSNGKSGSLTPNQAGIFPTLVITPNSSAELTLSYPDLPANTEVQLYAPDGGTIDGEAKVTRTLAANGSVSFKWEGNHNLGRHSVHSFAGPNADEKVVSFWVGPRAYADASEVLR